MSPMTPIEKAQEFCRRLNEAESATGCVLLSSDDLDVVVDGTRFSTAKDRGKWILTSDWSKED